MCACVCGNRENVKNIHTGHKQEDTGVRTWFLWAVRGCRDEKCRHFRVFWDYAGIKTHSCTHRGLLYRCTWCSCKRRGNISELQSKSLHASNQSRARSPSYPAPTLLATHSTGFKLSGYILTFSCDQMSGNKEKEAGESSGKEGENDERGQEKRH